MRLTMKVRYENDDDPAAEAEQVAVVAWHNDFIALEDEFDIEVGKEGDFGSMKHMCFLAWHSLHRRGKTELSFEEWLNQGVEVLPADLPDEVDVDQPTEVVVGAPEAEPQPAAV